MAPARLFHMDPTPILSAVSAKFGCAIKEIAGNDIITQLGSISR
jgi:hypothetical protein